MSCEYIEIENINKQRPVRCYQSCNLVITTCLPARRVAPNKNQTTQIYPTNDATSPLSPLPEPGPPRPCCQAQHMGAVGRAPCDALRPTRLRRPHPPRSRRTPGDRSRSGHRVASGAGARSSPPLPGGDPLGLPYLQHADGDALALRPPMRDVPIRRPAEREPTAADPAGTGAPLGVVTAVTATLRLRGRRARRIKIHQPGAQTQGPLRRRPGCIRGPRPTAGRRYQGPRARGPAAHRTSAPQASSRRCLVAAPARQHIRTRRPQGLRRPSCGRRRSCCPTSTL